MESSSPPVVRPVREILGENIVPLRISEPPKANGGRAVDSSVHTQVGVSIELYCTIFKIFKIPFGYWSVHFVYLSLSVVFWFSEDHGVKFP